MFKQKLAKFGRDLVSAVLWALFIAVIVLFSNTSTTQFIYNKF